MKRKGFKSLWAVALSVIMTIALLVPTGICSFGDEPGEGEYVGGEVSAWIVTGDRELNVGDYIDISGDYDLGGRNPEYFHLEWNSFDSSVASISPDGMFCGCSANKSGRATIGFMVVASDGEVVASDSITITVVDPTPAPTPAPTPVPQYISVNGIEINTSSITMNKGEVTSFKAWVKPDNANNKGISYSTSDGNVASVNGNGDVTATGAGSCVLTARTNENGYTATCRVTVIDNSPKNLPVTGVSLSPATLTIQVGQTYTLTPNIQPSNTINKQVIWDSTHPVYATVDYNGRVLGIAPGNAIINCTTVNGNKKAAVFVTVVPANQKTPANNSASNKNNKQAAGASNNGTHSAALNFMTISNIITAASKAEVVIEQDKPMSYDATVAMILATRPDIKLSCVFPLNGIKFKLTLPPKFDLASCLDKTGYVDWLTLCTKQGVLLSIVK